MDEFGYHAFKILFAQICTSIHFLYNRVQSSAHCQRNTIPLPSLHKRRLRTSQTLQFLHLVPQRNTMDNSAIEALTSHQQSQLNTVFPKQPFLGVIFLTLSWRNWNVPGEMWALSIVFTFGASSIDIGGDKACFIAQIARGRIYISDL